MKARLDYGRVAAGIYDAMDALDRYLGGCSLDEPLLHLVRLRASHARARAIFGEKELCDLTLAVATINAWNRLSIAARLVPGGYAPAASRTAS